MKNRRSLKVPRPTGWPGLPPTPQKGDNTRDWYPFSGMMQQIPPEVVCDFEGLPLNPPWQIVWGDLGHFWGNSIGVFGLYWRIENSGIKRRNPFICSVATFGDARPFLGAFEDFLHFHGMLARVLLCMFCSGGNSRPSWHSSRRPAPFYRADERLAGSRGLGSRGRGALGAGGLTCIASARSGFF